MGKYSAHLPIFCYNTQSIDLLTVDLFAVFSLATYCAGASTCHSYYMVESAISTHLVFNQRNSHYLMELFEICNLVVQYCVVPRP